MFEHNIQIISSTRRKESGYYLPADKTERWEFFAAFKKRAMTGIQKAAAIMNAPAIVAAVKLSIDAAENGKKIPGLGKALESIIEHFKSEPDLYQKEMEAVKSKFGALLVDRARMAEINEASAKLQALTKGFK